MIFAFMLALEKFCGKIPAEASQKVSRLHRRRRQEPSPATTGGFMQDRRPVKKES
jgi:hypothetical protein